jgi:hypothetical protein
MIIHTQGVSIENSRRYFSMRFEFEMCAKISKFQKVVEIVEEIFIFLS